MKFELKQLSDDIFSLTFDNHYDLALHFLRWSEFTESTDPKIKGNSFKILDFMESYAKEHDDVFTYPADWAGFNISGEVFKTLTYESIKDFNKYDLFMLRVVSFIKATIGDKPFYLIGHITDCQDTVDHEIAHAMYDRTPEYKEEIDEIIKNIKPKHREAINNTIKEMGYPEDVLDDELQAYCATGITGELRKCFRVQRIPKKMTKAFSEVFKNHKDILMNDK